MANTNSLSELVQHVWLAVQEVNDHIVNADSMANRISLAKQAWESKEEREKAGFRLFGWTEGEERFEELDCIKYWGMYFKDTLNQCEPERQPMRIRAIRNREPMEWMTVAQLDFVLEYMKAAATQLDTYGELLVAEYRRLPSVPAVRVQGVQQRRVMLKTFVKSLGAGLAQLEEQRQANMEASEGLRQRRRRPETGDADSDTDSRDSHPTTQSTQRDFAKHGTTGQQMRRRAGRALTSDSTLIAATMLVTLASAILQGHSFTLASDSPELPASQDPELFSMLASSLMQLLGLYTTVRPALSHRAVQTSYRRWAMMLAVASLVAPFAGLMIFVLVAPRAGQLVAFTGAVLQAVVALELVWALDRVLDKGHSEQKGDKDL